MSGSRSSVLFTRFVLLFSALMCVIGGLSRVFIQRSPDREALFFFISAAAIVLAESVRKFKFGDMEIEREIESVKAQLKELAEVSREDVAVPVGPPMPMRADAAGPGAAEPQELQSATLEEMAEQLKQEIYRKNLSYWNDPVLESEPFRSAPATDDKGNRISSRIERSKVYPEMFLVSIEVHITDAARFGSERRIALFLHHTFRNCVRIIPIVGGIAHLELHSLGCFTVGALLPDGTRLALNLADADLHALPEADRRRFLTS